MRSSLVIIPLVAVVSLSGSACSDGTGVTLDRPSKCVATYSPYHPSIAAFSARTTKFDVESGAGPNGYYYQYNLWLTIAPATEANAGVVVGLGVPVYLRTGGAAVEPYSVCLMRVGDSVEVWHDSTVGYGSAEAPPGAPVYFATQVLILRP